MRFKEVYHPKLNPIIEPFELAEFAYLDPINLINVIETVPGVARLIKTLGKLEAEANWLTGSHLEFHKLNQVFLPLEKWRDAVNLYLSNFCEELREIIDQTEALAGLNPLVSKTNDFQKSLSNWGIDQIAYNLGAFISEVTLFISSQIGRLGLSDEEALNEDSIYHRALSHPQILQRTIRAEVLSLYTLAAALHSVEHLCKSSPYNLSEYGKALFVGECSRLLDCAIPTHPNHLEIITLSRGILRLAVEEMSGNSDKFANCFYIVSEAVKLLRAELDYTSWRHHGTWNVFENRMPVSENIHKLANDYSELAKNKLKDALLKLHSYLIPSTDPGAIPIMPPTIEELREASAILAARNGLIIDPVQFVRIKIFSKDFPPPREYLREAQVIQNMRLSPDALLTIQTEKEFKGYIEQGKLSFITISLSDHLLAFFAISTDQSNLTESGEAAINELKKLKKYENKSFAFIELVASDITARYKLKPWTKGAWSFVSNTGENLALDSYEPGSQVVLTLIAREGIEAENVYASSGFIKTGKFLKLKFLGKYHRYNIWAKELSQFKI